MKSTGIIRQVDELGRVVLPMELRRVMELAEGEPMEFFVDYETNRIILRKYRTQECLFCKSADRIYYYRDKFICASCLRELKDAGRLAEAESAATVLTERGEEDKLNEDKREQASGKISKGARRGARRTDTLARLAAAMKEHPEATQSEWARMIGVSASRVNQLIRKHLN